jgi:4-hydroxy-3-polyprenylbenzoate decarboxylase
MNHGRRNRFDGRARWLVLLGNHRLDDGIGQRPFLRHRPGFRALINARAARQEQKHSDKDDSHKSEHAPILRNRNADTSRFNSCCYVCREVTGALSFPRLKILVAITGATGALYAQRLLDNLDPREHEIHVVLSNYAQQVIAVELPDGLKIPGGAQLHNVKSMNAPFASGSNPPDAMVVIPCTMGTMGRIAHGYSEDVLLRAADVTLKEKRKLILVPRETPLSLIHIKNMELLLLAGAIILPANPSFYSGADSVVQVVDTVVARVLDHIGIPNKLAPRWAEEKE